MDVPWLIYLFTSWWIFDIFLSLGPIWIKLPWTLVHRFLCEHSNWFISISILGIILNFSHSSKCTVSHCGLNLCFSNDSWCLATYVLTGIHTATKRGMSVQIICPFKELDCVSYYWVLRVLYIFQIQFLYQRNDFKMFSHSGSCLFTFDGVPSAFRMVSPPELSSQDPSHSQNELLIVS